MTDIKEETGEFLLTGQGIARIGGQTYEQLVESVIREAMQRMGPRPVLSAQGADLVDGPSEFEGLSIGALDRAFLATRDLLVEAGLEAVTLGRVVEIAGLTPVEALILCRHLPTPSALIAEVFERLNAPLMETLSKAAVEQGSVLDNLESIGRSWFEMACRDVPLYLVYIDVIRMRIPTGKVDPTLVELLVRQNSKKQAIFSGLLAEGQMRGEVRAGKVEVMMATLIGCFHGMLLILSNPQQLVAAGVYAEDVIEETIWVMIGGLRPHP